MSITSSGFQRSVTTVRFGFADFGLQRLRGR